MFKAFLSHSSKQKGYVEIVAKSLKKANIVYDSFSFEVGAKTIDEIYEWLGKTGVFVFFITVDSLNSDWVRLEVNKAIECVDKSDINKMLPIIIDENVSYDDHKIPSWIKENYNLKYVSRPTKVAERIRQVLREISWDIYPHVKELSQLFIGRTSLIKKFEERLYDYDKSVPVVLIVTGLPSIGRRKFVVHCLKKASLIREYYSPSSVVLNTTDSIEDFILALYDLGYSKIDENDLKGLINVSIGNKIDILANLLIELSASQPVLFVVDNYCIVNGNGTIVDWFIRVLSKLDGLEPYFLCLISRARVRYRQIYNQENVYSVEMPELEKYERKALFNSLLKIEKININKSDFGVISDLFTGFPEQVIFAFNLLRIDGIAWLRNNLYAIAEYNSEKVLHVVRKYESDSLSMAVMGFLADNEFVSMSVLETVFHGENIEVIIEEFSKSFVLEFVGSTREYFRLNDAIKDHIKRLDIRLGEDHQRNFDSHIRAVLSDYDVIERDLSDYAIAIKQALIKGYDFDKSFALPSHYIKAMRELYEYERNYGEVISLADRVLLEEKYLDARILREVRYWLCLSLARKRDRRMLEEVQKIEGPDHNFLLGFYYRLDGRLDDSVEKLLAVLKSYPNYYKAKRELVQVYLYLDEYDLAYDLAKENYEFSKSNPYSLQDYYRCLLKRNASKYELIELLDKLKENPHKKAAEMYKCAYAQYLAYVEHDVGKALNEARDASSAFPNSIYPYLIILEICLYFQDYSEMRKAVIGIDGRFSSSSDIYSKLTYLRSKIVIYIIDKRERDALDILNKKIRPRVTKNVFRKISEEMDYLKRYFLQN